MPCYFHEPSWAKNSKQCQPRKPQPSNHNSRHKFTLSSRGSAGLRKAEACQRRSCTEPAEGISAFYLQRQVQGFGKGTGFRGCGKTLDAYQGMPPGMPK